MYRDGCCMLATNLKCGNSTGSLCLLGVVSGGA